MLGELGTAVQEKVVRLTLEVRAMLVIPPAQNCCPLGVKVIFATGLTVTMKFEILPSHPFRLGVTA
jgi:hypothetical protein